MTKSGPDPPRADPGARGPNGPRRDRPMLLVVDDEAEVLHSVHDLLRLDYQVLTCDQPTEALRLLTSDAPIQVIMSDQRMAGMTGVELLAYARRLRPDVTRLLFTAYADIKAVIDAINQGSVYRYIGKPWDPDELQLVVRQAVEQNELIVQRDRLLAELTETNRLLIEANRLKSAFIEVASHELNTPTAVVLGLAQLWKLSQGDKASPAERQWVDRMQHAGKRLASTVEKMLKLIRSDELTRSLDLSETPLGPLIERAVSAMAPFLEARGQKIEVRLDPELGEAEVDAPKVIDVLSNLLVNAVKFTPDGGTITVSAGPAGPRDVRFAVTDRGVGITPEVQAHVFEPFFTGFDTMHHSSGEFEFGKRGIGLGLCLVKRFVELHGGRVELTSEPGHGSTFSFTIPRRPTPRRLAEREPAP